MKREPARFFLQLCWRCEKQHRMIYAKCSCGQWDTPQPLSAKIRATCKAAYKCLACQDLQAQKDAEYR